MTFVRFFLLLLLMFAACEREHLGQAELPENWQEDLTEWKQNRIESLKQPAGWLRLAGMFEIREGSNSFGSGEGQDLRFPTGSLPDHAGYIFLEENIVTMKMAEGLQAGAGEKMVAEIILYDGESTPSVTYDSLEWFVIVRQDLIAIRLYNKENEKADAFDGFPAYPEDPSWVREAIFEPSPEGAVIEIVNVLGQTDRVASPGTLHFTVDGKSYSLDALEGTERMFIILGDQTNRTETYQAGRFLYVDYPEEGSSRTVIDFNKTYNPPCAFNVYTTCQLPPPQNRLDAAVTAGEKRPVGWTGIEI
ncbi:MAG: DUF1684 domain-containing protein [Balneolaceae bacterium]|nr:MAG: DUF1684 domain-containing protein [Balneolaceae bacterium]